MTKRILAVAISLVSLIPIGCGSSNKLQSISINQSGTTAAPEFTASGTFTNGTNNSTLPVNWTITGPGVDPPPPGYTLSSAPFFPPCILSGSTYMVEAVAPADPNAPSSGSVPANVWNDLITGKAKSEGGFVAATSQFTCA